MRSVMGITKKPVLAPNSKWADRIFTEIIGKVTPTIFEISHKMGTAVLNISNCFIHSGYADR